MRTLPPRVRAPQPGRQRHDQPLSAGGAGRRQEWRRAPIRSRVATIVGAGVTLRALVLLVRRPSLVLWGLRGAAGQHRRHGLRAAIRFQRVLCRNQRQDVPRALRGQSVPGADAAEESQRRLLPVMQANRPRPRLTFTDDVPAELPRPDYRLVLVFDSAIDLTAARVCAGEVRHQPRRVEAARAVSRCSPSIAATISRCRSRPRGRRRQVRRIREVGQLFSQLFLVILHRRAAARSSSFPGCSRASDEGDDGKRPWVLSFALSARRTATG